MNYLQNQTQRNMWMKARTVKMYTQFRNTIRMIFFLIIEETASQILEHNVEL